jgi:hypothetical protein
MGISLLKELSMSVSYYWSMLARGLRLGGYAVAGVLLACLLFSACSNPFAGGKPTSTATPSSLALAKLKWCTQPFIVFRDERPTTATPGSSTPSTTPTTTPTATATATASATPGATGTVGPETLTNWSQVQPLLGFTVYLPAHLPNGTCLVSASGTVHDPIFGGSFTIGYLLPNHTALSLSEAPQGSNSLSFQCTQSSGSAQQTGHAATATPTASPTAQPYEVCSGVKGSTNVVFSEQGSVASLTQFYNQLLPGVAWVPAS